MKTKPELFLDSSALLGGLVSGGAAGTLLLLGETGHVRLVTSARALAEIERTLARLAPRAQAPFRQGLHAANLRTVPDPDPEQAAAHPGLGAPPADHPIVLAAMLSGAEFLVTVTRRHFFTGSDVALATGLATADPAGALLMVRRRLEPRE